MQAATDATPSDGARSETSFAHVTISIDSPGTLVSVSGRLAASTVAELRAVLVAAADSGCGDLVLDLDGAEIVDASGLGVLIGAHRVAARRERRLVLRRVPARVERLLIATRLNRVLTLET
ncbi:MAG TPA: STAS domain-containing protein [Mycobacteriales bacterium]|jgi:anti-anti-sigma factor|nr:STAS domain-containing protein [Mycobacteriales bacterium]